MSEALATNNVTLISLDAISYDPRVQRREGIDERRASTIAAEWNPGAAGVLNISKRPDGCMVIVDGAHRWKAGQILGIKEMLAIVHEGLSIQQEAALFLLLNTFKAPSAISRFLAQVVKGEKAALEIARLIESHGWRIQTSADPGCITAVSALEAIYTSASGVLASGEHPDVLDWVLEVTTAAWEHDPTSVNNAVLRGLAQMRGRYGKAIQTNKLVRDLQKTRPLVLVGKAKIIKDGQGGTIAAAMGKVLTGVHNNRLRTEQLPEWVWTR